MPTVMELPIWFSFEVVEAKQKSIEQLAESNKKSSKRKNNQTLSSSNLDTFRIKYDNNYNYQDIVLISPLRQSTAYYRYE
jgi:hypothetical protein